MTYGELRAKGTNGWTTNHVIDDFCNNARFCNKNGWKDDAVSEYEMGIINHWMAKEGAVFLNRDAALIPNHLFYGTPGQPCTTCNEKHSA